MIVLIYILVYGIGIAFSVAILALSLFLVEDSRSSDSSFREFGVVGTLARCAAVVVATTLVSLIPFGVLIALVIWFLAIMFLFGKSFGQTLLIFVVNVIASLAIGRAIVYLLERLVA